MQCANPGCRTLSAFRGTREYLIENAYLPDLSADLLAFYETMDKQVFSIEQSGADQQITIEAAPEGVINESHTIEYLTRPPFVRLR